MDARKKYKFPRGGYRKTEESAFVQETMMAELKDSIVTAIVQVLWGPLPFPRPPNPYWLC
jgi:hypothetical protein